MKYREGGSVVDFEKGDIVRCPSGRRAKIRGMLPDGKLDAVYVNGINQPFARDDTTILDPRYLKRIDD